MGILSEIFDKKRAPESDSDISYDVALAKSKPPSIWTKLYEDGSYGSYKKPENQDSEKPSEEPEKSSD